MIIIRIRIRIKEISRNQEKKIDKAKTYRDVIRKKKCVKRKTKSADQDLPELSAFKIHISFMNLRSNHIFKTVFWIHKH